MINVIVDAIAAAIQNDFGDEYMIYTENVEQGQNKPCFFIACTSAGEKHYFHKTYNIKSTFCIKYVPASNQINKECNDIFIRLSNTLEYIPIESNLIRGTNMSCEMADGVLSMIVHYNMFIQKDMAPQEVMEEITSSTAVNSK